MDSSKRAVLSSFIHTSAFSACYHPGKGADMMKAMQVYSGMLVEVLMMFKKPDEALEAAYEEMAVVLGTEPFEGRLGEKTLPPLYIIDREMERGRDIARKTTQEWVDCPFDFYEALIQLITDTLLFWEQEGAWRAETFRIFIELANRSMSLEMAAQELCDVIIECKIGRDGWSLADGLTGLSGICGRNLARALNGKGWWRPTRTNLLASPYNDVLFVMTQEASRLGISAKTDWSRGLPANDCPADPPNELVDSIEPYCKVFMEMIGMTSLQDQAVGSAKAAGRMLAVLAGGEEPEMAPVIAKPLAMAALTETYKSIFTDFAIVS